MNQYNTLDEAHNMVLFQGGLAGNFISYLIAIHSLNLPLGSPTKGAYNEYSLGNAQENSEVDDCIFLKDKSLMLAQHIFLFFSDTSENEVYTASRYHEVFSRYQDTHIVVITVDATDIELLKWISKVMTSKAFHNDEYEGYDGDWGHTDNRGVNLDALDRYTNKLVRSMRHHKWFISRAKKKNINVLEVDYRKLFIDRDEKVISELFNFPKYTIESVELKDICNTIEKYHQQNILVVEHFEKILPSILREK
jgi:hypothetical protein